MLKYEELRALLEVLFDDRGWQKIDTGSFRLLMQAPQSAMPQGGGHMPEVGQLTVGLNWGHPQGRIAGTFLILRSGDPELLKKLEEAWTAAMPKLGRLRIPAANFIEHAVHQVPCANHGPSLEEVCGDLLHAISTDGAGARHLIGLADEGPPGNSAWRRLLYRARDAGQGPLAMFEDDVAQLVCDFVAPDPRR